MSWPLASFTLIGLVLLVGWLAYERARPSARMVAVVATLAAVAALGRDADTDAPRGPLQLDGNRGMAVGT